jgi:hypothetical protein
MDLLAPLPADEDGVIEVVLGAGATAVETGAGAILGLGVTLVLGVLVTKLTL